MIRNKLGFESMYAYKTAEPEEDLKIWGASSKLRSIICSPLIRMGSTDLPKLGGGRVPPALNYVQYT